LIDRTLRLQKGGGGYKDTLTPKEVWVLTNSKMDNQ